MEKIMLITALILPMDMATSEPLKSDEFSKVWNDESRMREIDSTAFDIKSKKYVFNVLNIAKDDKEKYSPTIIFYEIKNNQRTLIFQKPADQHMVFGSPGFSIRARNDSIYIRADFAHHGLYYNEYQFKKINDDFILIGEKYQSITLLNDEIKTSQQEGAEPSLHINRGGSRNWLTKNSECWIAIYDCKTNRDACKDNIERFNKGIPPRKIDSQKNSSFSYKKNISLADFSSSEDIEHEDMCWIDARTVINNKK